MAEVRIYKLDLSGSDVSETAAYVSSNHGGAGTPYAETEIARLENIYRQENAGANGQHVLNAIDMEDFTVSWVNLCEVGNLANGEYDCRGGGAGHPLKVRWQQYFSSSALQEGGSGRYPLLLVHGGAETHPSGSGGVFIELQMLHDSGANFDWFCRYRKRVASTNTSSLTGTNIDGIADVADDAEHQCIMTIVPSTITGAYVGDGFLGTATVASDGHISLAVGDYDGSNMQTVLSASGLQFVINHLATTNPAVYYGKGVWHGII